MRDKQYGENMQAAYESFLSTIKQYGMEEKIRGGVLIGFSGGPDSVLLLHLLLRYKCKYPFHIVAVHVHHGIRGESADRDALFAENVCRALGVEFILHKANVPVLARERKIGIEEAARNVRYACFVDIISGRNDVSAIALGHNATDNAETVIFHLMRGCGIGGLAGIPPMRECIVRPLIALPKSMVLAALEESGISFVFDETNDDTAYTRNYIRHEILPRLSHISSLPEVSVGRVCRNLISDNDFIESEATHAFGAIQDNTASRETLLKMHPAILSRVLRRWGQSNGSTLEQSHIEKLEELISMNPHFSYDLPSGTQFLCENGVCRFAKNREEASKASKNLYIKIEKDQPIQLENSLFLITSDKSHKSCSNIYNFSIKANLSSAIIVGDMFLRRRNDGDAYYYGNMTHKLKKLFNDKKIPLQKREEIPILCDEKGIVWVPGFGVRDDGGSADEALFATFFY